MRWMTRPTSRRHFLAALPALVIAACTGRTRGPRATAEPPTAPASTSTRPGEARFVQHGTATRPIVAFTFHGSGDVALLDDLLAVAAAHHAPLTIFAIGQWLDANPEVAGKILGAGHELA